MKIDIPVSDLELYHTDAFEWMQNYLSQHPDSVDLIITDPPY